jgi:hypothetical protein
LLVFLDSPVFVVCSWCSALMGVVLPLEDGRLSHGLCTRCSDRVSLEHWPSIRAVIVVHRTRPLLYEHLRRALEEVPHVRVVLDQRSAERRRTPAQPDPDQRRAPRRRPWSKKEREAWRSLRVVVVRCR